MVTEQREEEKLALDLLDKAELAGGATMSDAAKFDLNKTIGNTGQDFPTADQIKLDHNFEKDIIKTVE